MSQSDRKFHLAVCDPPYNFGQEYDACDDSKSYSEYVAWTREWLTLSVECLHKHGSLWVFAPDEWVSEVDMLCRRKLKLFKRRHVVWAFTFGQKAQNNFTRSHTHILYFTKAKTKFTFNGDQLKVPSARQHVYKDARAKKGGKLPDATWMLLKDQLAPYMTPDKNTWLVSRICGTFHERKNHSPNQIPVPIMERIVLACSNPGDWVLDPFAGTGASGVACKMHNRNWLGYDLSSTCVKECNRRIAET
jgi:site-specific DNA-methyltransferase (adenine-specific)